MLRKISVAGAVVLTMAGVVTVGTASAASAAPKAKCWVGSWKVTTAKVKIDDVKKNLHVIAVGGAGAKVKLAKNGTAYYNFTGSKGITGKGLAGGLTTSVTVKLSKKLTVPGKLAGSKKGKFTGKVAKAKGDAVATVKVSLPPLTIKLALAKAAKSGGDYGVVPKKATYTCSGKNLTFHQKSVAKGITTVSDWKLKRS
ncbi:MAG: hypothetical protein ABIS86_06770 [Streptosporangiaceae bacterium]